MLLALLIEPLSIKVTSISLQALFIHAVCHDLGRYDLAYVNGNTGNQFKHRYLTWYGRCPSIVRYRTAVKDPMDLLYLFWAITSGITVAVCVLAVVTSIVILLMLIVFSRLQETGKVYIAVVHFDGEHTGDKVIQELVASNTLSSLKLCEKTVLRWLLKSL
ncbi:MAG: hypothetical protein ACLS5K_03695 [Streptococcus salivarius]